MAVPKHPKESIQAWFAPFYVAKDLVGTKSEVRDASLVFHDDARLALFRTSDDPGGGIARRHDCLE